MPSRQIFQFILVFQFIYSVSAQAVKSPFEHWKESGLTFEEAVGGILLPNCYRSEGGFLGCLAALNSLGRNFETPVMLIPNTLIGDPDVPQGERWKRLNEAFSLVKLPTESPQLSPYQAFQKQKKEDQKIVNREKEIFDFVSRTGAGFDFQLAFEQFYREVQANKKNVGKIEFITGVAINEGLKFQMDPHTRIAPTSTFEEMSQEQSISGVGMVFSQRKRDIVVSSLTEGGAARTSGKIKKGDILLAYKLNRKSEWVSTSDKNLEEVVGHVRGPENTTISMRFQRLDLIYEVTLTRKKITFPNVVIKKVNNLGTTYGYIRLGSFMDDSGCKKIRDGIRLLEAEKAKGLIFDLRDNGGGLLTQAQCIAGLFVGPKVVVGVKSLKEENSPIEFEKSISVEALERYNARSIGGRLRILGEVLFSRVLESMSVVRPNKQKDLGTKQTNLPLAVLIDAGSASASEVVSGALQDHQAAWIVGERSFGKATVQGVTPLKSYPKLTLALTIARFYQPSGRTNQVVGIQPDFVVPYKPDATEEERFSPREEDQYVNPLPPVGPAWSQSRPQLVAQIEDCRRAQRWAEDKYRAANLEVDEDVDFQKWSAEEILFCSGAR